MNLTLVYAEKIKKRVIDLISMKDKGILGAFMLYQDDKDFEGFKARIIHKVMTPNGSREAKEYSKGTGTSSSATTGGFQYPNTAVGGSRRRIQQYSDSYMPIVTDLEQKQLLNDDTSSIIKQLILDENVDI